MKLTYTTWCYLQWGNELDAPSPLFLEQSYNVTHLLQQATTQKTCEDVSIIHSTILGTNNWKLANQQYFRCLATMQQLRQISLKFNKDLGLEEVSSYLFAFLSVLVFWHHRWCMYQICVYGLTAWAICRLIGLQILWTTYRPCCVNKDILLTIYLSS